MNDQTVVTAYGVCLLLATWISITVASCVQAVTVVLYETEKCTHFPRENGDIVPHEWSDSFLCSLKGIASAIEIMQQES